MLSELDAVGDLLAKLWRNDEARAEFERAAGLARNGRERELLLERARGLAGQAGQRVAAPSTRQRQQHDP